MSRKKYGPSLTVTYDVECEPMQEPVRGYFASGNDEQDRIDEEEILQRLDRGDTWAWCNVRVKATADSGDVAYSDWLGACTYESEADYRASSGYFDDQCHEARSRLLRVEQSQCQAIKVTYSGRRLCAAAQPGRKYYPRDFAMSYQDNYTAVAAQYAADQGWTGHWVGALLPTPGKTAYLFVCVPKASA